MLSLTTLKLAMKAPGVLGCAAELIEEIQSTNKVMTREDRSRLLSRYWALVKAVQSG